jgi:site-specific recombinase XerD
MANGFVDGFCLRLANQFSQGQIRTIREQLDIYSMGFTITQIEAGIVAVDYELPKELAVFLEVKRQDGRMNNRSYDQYYSCLTKLLYDLRLPLRSITVNHLRMHIAGISINKRTGKPLSQTTLDQRKSIIRSFFRWLYEEEYIESDPSTRIKPVRAAYKPREAYADTQIEAIRDSCKNDRDRAIVDLLSASGIRVEECCRLDRSDIDLEKREIKVFGKGHKYRTSFIDARTVVSVEKYLKSRDDNEAPLFVSIRRPHKRLNTGAIRKMLERLEPESGVNNIIPHRFRHTTATTAISNGMPVESVQAMLGHSLINTTMRYAHVSYDKVKREHDTYMRQ